MHRLTMNRIRVGSLELLSDLSSHTNRPGIIGLYETDDEAT